MAHRSQPLAIMLATVGHALATHAIALFMLTVGLRTDRYVVVRMLRDHRGLVIRALLAVWIAVPVASLAILYGVRPPPLSAATLMVMAICPGVPLLLNKTDRAHGDRDTALIVLIASLVTAVALTPLWALILRRFTPLAIDARMRDVFAVVMPALIIPYVVGRIVRTFSPRIAERLATITNVLFLAGLVLIVVVLVKKTGLGLGSISIRGTVACLAIGFVAGTIGYVAISGRVDQRVSATYATAFGNPALALAVMAHSDEANAAPLIVLFLVLRTVSFVPFTLWLRREHKTHQGLTYA